jgi:hypothetical protein
MQGNPIPATQTFAVTLQAQEWQTVIAAMAEAPYKQSAPLIQAITQQIQEQAQSLEEGGGMSPMPNGQMMTTTPN